MTKKFDPTKPVRTTCGKPARIVDCNFKTTYSSVLLLAIISYGSYDSVNLNYQDGAALGIGSLTLENIPERKSFYKAIGPIAPHWNHSYQEIEYAQTANPNSNQFVKLTYEGNILVEVEIINV